MENQPQSDDLLPPGCGMWISWILASMAGMGLGWALGWLASFAVPPALSTLGLGLVTGLVLGVFQWLVLRGQMADAGWWVFACVLGWMGGFALGAITAQSLGLTGAWFGLATGAFTGAFLGLVQWTLLRRSASRAIWWLPASIIGWSSALLYYQPGITVFGALYGLLYGLVSGLALLWLFYRPTAE